LGQTGNWNGEDIIRIVCEQPATARFLARHLYNYFVADEPQIPAWRLTPPRDQAAIEAMEKAYYDSDHSIKAMLEVLFNSDFFKDESVRYQKVKNPTEMVVSLLRMTGEFKGYQPGLFEASQEPKYMGMDLMNPPTVEGWHTGREWIDSGTLVERINFASDLLGNTELAGVRSLVDRLMGLGAKLTPEQFVNACLDLTGPVQVFPDTMTQLVGHASREGDLSHGNDAELTDFTRRTGEMFQMIAATAEFQFE